MLYRLYHRGPTPAVWVADYYFIVNVLSRFTVCLTYRHISLTVYINQQDGLWLARVDLATCTHSSRSNTVRFWFSSRASSRSFGWIFDWKVREESWIYWPLCCEVWKRSDAILEKNRPGARTLSKQGFLPCPSIIRNSQRRTQIHSKSLKKPLLRQMDNYTPQVRQFNIYLSLIYNTVSDIWLCFPWSSLMHFMVQVVQPQGATQSVWVADCYFIVNVLDLPFASPIGIYLSLIYIHS